MGKIIKYNKLIRDKIPEICTAAGAIPKIRTLRLSEFRRELRKKVVEESHELIKAKTKDDIINELADIEELLIWIKKEYKIKDSSIVKYRKEKNRKRGSFKKKLFLIQTVKK